ncbi:histone H1 [Hemitrygon akajei]|uniref:histone H1 n=1 Tax=Hemitrygon akajei TaxID=2704970 RepID=UPI003BF945DB
MTETAAAEVTPPAAPAAATKAPKKKAAARAKTAGPKLGEQIDKIVADCRSHRGVSIVAIKKELAANGVDVEKLKSQIKMVIKRKLESGSLVHTKGAGASGSLKAAKKDSTRENREKNEETSR